MSLLLTVPGCSRQGRGVLQLLFLHNPSFSSLQQKNSLQVSCKNMNIYFEIESPACNVQQNNFSIFYQPIEGEMYIYYHGKIIL